MAKVALLIGVSEYEPGFTPLPAARKDATIAIVKGLQQSKTREDLQKALHSPGLSVNGATGKIQFFTQSGDRKDNPIFLVKVQQIPGTDKYEFAPIKP